MECVQSTVEIIFLLVVSFSNGFLGLVPDVTNACCDLGRAWAIQSEELCGPYPESYISTMLYGVHETLACTALVDICCVTMRREKQCSAGKETALLLNRCDSLHIYQANEDAKECCNCCQFGLVIHQVGLVCQLPVQLSSSPQCLVTFTECCLGQSPAAGSLPPADSPLFGETEGAFSNLPPTRPMFVPPFTTTRHIWLAPTTTRYRSVQEIDECQQFYGELCAHECVNTIDSYYCTCRDGFVLQSDGKSCRQIQTDSEDIDECLLGTDTCSLGQRCVNTIGSFRCENNILPPATTTMIRTTTSSSSNTTPNRSGRCTKGFAWNRITRECEDIDECIIDLHDCPSNQTCVNTEGHYQCVAEIDDGDIYDDYYPETNLPDSQDVHDTMREDRYEETTTVGTLIRLLTNPPQTQRRTTTARSTTTATTTQRQKQTTTEDVQCPTGYLYDLRRRRCTDVNECATGDHDCRLPNQICANTQGSYNCRCVDGYRFNRSTKFCEDIDECHTTSACTGGQICENTLGSFTCNCETGYLFNQQRQQCTDIDECRLEIRSCAVFEDCLNTPGSYRCSVKQCPRGNRLDHQTGICVPIICSRGMRTDHTGTCIDINECAVRPNPCRPHQECRNTVGSYECHSVLNCGEGYELNEHTGRCEDINECQRGTHTCEGSHIQCINRPGSYHCLCPDGYQLDHRRQSCEDINECSVRPNACRPHQECRNTFGSYECHSVLNCGAGYELNENAGRCEDIDECQRGTHKCEGYLVQCMNRPGSYHCLCPDGYQLDQRRNSCEDIDECRVSGSRMCSQNSECENTLGSYRCRCKEGFESAEEDNRVCRDVDECLQPRMCEHECHNTWGSYRCSCRNGYQLNADSRSCADIDECAVWSQRGSLLCQGICENTPGSYRCTCPSGYTLTSDGRVCKDVDECENSANINCNGPDDVCINTRGGYKCEVITCPKGFNKVTTTNTKNSQAIRCQRKSFACPQGDVECLYAPISYSVNFIAIPVKIIHVPTDLFTMRGPVTTNRRLAFELKVLRARDPRTGAVRANRAYFHLNQVRPNEAVVQLIHEIQGSQDIELQLDMNVYSREFRDNSDEIFYGTAIAKIFIYVTEDAW